MSEFRALLDGLGPFADVSFGGQTSAAVVASIPLAALFLCAAQTGKEGAAEELVVPDMAIDGFVADGEITAQSQQTGDLLGAPQLEQQALDETEFSGRESAIAAGTGATARGHFNRTARPVAAIVTAGVTLEFSANGAAVSSEIARDLGLGVTLFFERSKHIPFFGGELAVRHGDFSICGKTENSRVLQVTSFSGGCVALTL